MNHEQLEKYVSNMTRTSTELDRDLQHLENATQAIAAAMGRADPGVDEVELEPTFLRSYMNRARYWMSVLNKKDNATFDVLMNGFLYSLKKSDNGLFIKIQNAMQRLSS